MSTAIAEKKLSTKPAEPDDRQRARQSKRHPDCLPTTIKLTAHANIACVIVGPRQSSSRRDRRNGHPDCRCVPIQIVALQGDAPRCPRDHRPHPLYNRRNSAQLPPYLAAGRVLSNPPIMAAIPEHRLLVDPLAQTGGRRCEGDYEGT